jgi:Arc-like DNA binding domain
MGADRMAAKKRIGRPPKAKEDRKAVNFTFRSRDQMRERLEAAAAASGRSISEEIEYRLNQSFDEERLSAAFLGGNDTAKALQLIANAMRLETAAGDGTPWSKDQRKAEAVQTAATLLIAGSAGLPVVPPTTVVTELGDPSERGRKLAKSLLEISNLSLPGEGEKK